MSRRTGVFRQKWIWLAALAVVVLLAGMWRPTAYVRPAQKTKRSVVSQAAVPQGQRKVFPLSVIRGGAYTAAEFARARRTDPVIEAHYASFGTRPMFKKTPRDLMMYVSYRKGKDVYWSQVRHRIPKGETVIADGSSLARARCGNRLSAIPQAPVAPGTQPAEEVMNTPEAPEEVVPYELAALPSPGGAPFQFFLPAGFDIPPAGALAGAGPGGGGAGPGSGGGYPGGPGFFGGGSGPVLGASRPGTNGVAPFAPAGPIAGTTKPSTTVPGTSTLPTIPSGAPGAPILGGIGPANSPVPSPVPGVVISSNGLPSSPNYPTNTHIPSETVSELAPEPSLLGLTAFAFGLLLLVRYCRRHGILRR